jgi:hypothetical protein
MKRALLLRAVLPSIGEGFARPGGGENHEAAHERGNLIALQCPQPVSRLR